MKIPVFDGETFHGGVLPVAESNTAIKVTGLGRDGLIFTEEEIVYALANHYDFPPPEPFPKDIAEILLTSKSTRDGVSASSEAYQQLGQPTFRQGEALIANVDNKLRVDWSTRLARTGYGIVAASGVQALYLPGGRKSKSISRKLNGDPQLVTNSAFEELRRNSTLAGPLPPTRTNK